MTPKAVLLWKEKKTHNKIQFHILKGSVLNAKVVCLTLRVSTCYFSPDIYTRNSTPNTFFFYFKTKKHFICQSPYKQIMTAWYFQVKCTHLNFKLSIFHSWNTPCLLKGDACISLFVPLLLPGPLHLWNSWPFYIPGLQLKLSPNPLMLVLQKNVHPLGAFFFVTE